MWARVDADTCASFAFGSVTRVGAAHLKYDEHILVNCSKLGFTLSSVLACLDKIVLLKGIARCASQLLSLNYRNW